MLYDISIYGIPCLILLLAFYQRHAIIARLPPRIADRIPQRLTRRVGGQYAPLNTFADQRSAGLSSGAFDIEANMADGDSRTGLDEAGAAEVQAIMQSHRVNFDQARLIRQNQILARNGIDPSGMPLDSKAVTRL